jgi:hypothetical protein
MIRFEFGPDTAMYAFTSTVQLEAFYGCGTQLLLESLLRTAARPEPPDGPLTAIGAAASMPQDGFESPFAPQDLSRSAGSWELSNGEE